MRNVILLLVLSIIVANCRKNDEEEPADPPAKGKPTKPDPSKSPNTEPNPEALRVVAISAGHLHACALLNDGRVKCWGGDADDDQMEGRGNFALGIGKKTNIGDEQNEMGDNLKAADLGTNIKAKAISAGGYHTCALLSDGKVKCWGEGGYGQLGQDNSEDLGDEPGEMGDKLKAIDLSRPAKAISAGHVHTCALLDSGEVKCWGDGQFGRLGQDSESVIGNDAGEMAGLQAIDLGAKALAVSAGGLHTCALLAVGTIKCWGSGQQGKTGQNSEGYLGDGLDEDSEPLPDGVSEMGQNLPAVDLGANANAVAVTTRGDHTCALLDDGRLKCWGKGDDGQLGQGNTERLGDGKDKDSQNSDKDEMGDNLPAVDLGPDVEVTAVTTGDNHTCVLLAGGAVKCWGSSFRGQLGQGNTTPIGGNPGEMGDTLKAIDLGTGAEAIAVSAGDSFTCALLNDGAVKCWGDGAGGKLGQGDEKNLGDEVGDKLKAIDILGSES